MQLQTNNEHLWSHHGWISLKTFSRLSVSHPFTAFTSPLRRTPEVCYYVTWDFVCQLTSALGLGVIPAAVCADQAGGARHHRPGGRALVEDDPALGPGHGAASDHWGHVLQGTRGQVTNRDPGQHNIIRSSGTNNRLIITCQSPSFFRCSEPGCGPIWIGSIKYREMQGAGFQQYLLNPRLHLYL